MKKILIFLTFLSFTFALNAQVNAGTEANANYNIKTQDVVRLSFGGTGRVISGTITDLILTLTDSARITATTIGLDGEVKFTGNSTHLWHVLFTDNTYDIGASGATRPRTGYFGTSVVAPTIVPTNITGTTTNNNAAAGAVGEYVSSTLAVGSALSLTTATTLNIDTLTLTAGDWDVEGNVNFSGSSVTITTLTAAITSTSATLPTDGTEVESGVQPVSALTIKDGITIPRKRISIAGTTNIYLVASAAFSTGTVVGYGSITARRVR